ncbi:MAG TPA: DUF58 domain-containing protein [Mycobacteriales bacterium]|nr:DUF58 domain-containing protein [Mycobacteriales bacterium]
MRPTARARELWRSITRRGRAFALAGVACLIAAQALGERDLLRVSALLFSLPIIALVIVTRTRYRLRLVRTLTPARVEAGTSARVLLHMENVSRLPSNVLLMEDVLPYALGGRPRFVLRQIEPSGVREATYSVRCEVRGRYEIGPLTVRLTDPFGCVELSRSFTSRETLTVTPKVFALPSVRLGGDWYGGGEGRSSQVAITGEADVATREYRRGDDLRKVHWRSTAKRGELMVRRDEQPRQNRATLLLDTRRTAHRGDGPGASFEWSVSALASVGVWLTRRGYTLRLASTGGLMVSASSPSLAEGVLLDSLSIVQAGSEQVIDEALRGVVGHGGGGLVVAVVGITDERTVGQLARVPAAASAAVLILVDAAAWAGTTPRNRAAAAATLGYAHDALSVAGWRVLVARHGDAIADLWPEAAHRPSDSSAYAGSWRAPAAAAAGAGVGDVG